MNLIAVPIDEHTKVYIEAIVDDNGNGVFSNASSGTGNRIFEKAKGYLDEKMLQIRAFVNNIVNCIENSDNKPDELEVEFAIKFSTEAGAIISSVGSEAGITVKLKWSNTKNGD